MVLFKEDDQRIKAQEKREKLARRTPLGRWVRRIVKIFAGVAAFFAVGLLLLSMLNGANPALKKGIEDYLSQATGLRAEIGTFTQMAFFPVLTVDMGDVALYRGDGKTPVATLGRLAFTGGFFDMMFSRRRVERLRIEKLKADSGVFGAAALALDVLAVEPDTYEGGPGLHAGGRYGARVFSVRLAMEGGPGDGGRTLYEMPEKGPFALEFGTLSAAGTLGRARGGGLELRVDSLSAPGGESLLGTLVLRRRWGVLETTVSATFGESRLDARLRREDGAWSGLFDFPVLNPADLAGPVRLYVQAADGGAGDGRFDLARVDADLRVRVRDLRAGTASIGALDAPVRVAEGALTAGPLSGTVNGGRLSGRGVFDTAVSPAALTVHAGLDRWDFGAYQKALFGRENVTGTANIRVDLKSKGDTAAALLRSLEGKAAMVAGEGKFASAALNIWGGGLVRAMLPSLEPDSLTTLNCLIADFDVKEGIARPAPFLMDTARVTVVGEGEINLPDNKISVKLEPKAKDPAFLDVATAIRISGPLGAPSIGPDTVSLFAKLGGLALGIVNPATLLFSLTDLGLTDSHPCHEFIGAPPEKKVEEKKDAAPSERSKPNE